MSPIKQYVEIRDPLYGRIDASPFQTILHSPSIQKTAQLKQLGGAYIVFPNAVHTRLSHMLGVAHITCIRVRWLLDRKEITTDEAKAVIALAICHDVGHGPFSHLIESVRGNHDVRGELLITTELAEVIRESGTSPEEVLELMKRKSTLSEIVFANPLGADKIDYLARDAYFALGDQLRLDDLFTTHVRFNRDTGLYLLPRGLPLLIATVQRYWYQYSEVYERISVRLLQRYLQELLRQVANLDPIVNRQLENGGEDGMIGGIAYWCDGQPDHTCSERYRRFIQRAHPRKTLIFTPYPDLVPIRRKATLAKLECDPELLARSEGWDLEKLALLEMRIADLIGVSATEVAVAPAPPERRWKIPDVKIQSDDGIRSLSALAPELLGASQVSMRMARTLAVGLEVSVRERIVSDPAIQQEIQHILLS